MRELPSAEATGRGGCVWLNGEEMYRISGVDRLPPFLMSIVSHSNHWMYVTSTGGLTAARVEAARCLFPYETDDRLYRGTTQLDRLLTERLFVYNRLRGERDGVADLDLRTSLGAGPAIRSAETRKIAPTAS